MDIKFSKDRIELLKELNSLDKLAIDFSDLLDKTKIKNLAELYGKNINSYPIQTVSDVRKLFEKNKFEIGKMLA